MTYYVSTLGENKNKINKTLEKHGKCRVYR
jgi:hypothetical protein